MSDPTYSALLAQAGETLRNDFEDIRKLAPHAGQQGTEVEQILLDFLNVHLPRRFHSSSGFVIDGEGGISKQTDVVVYDALSSPVYRVTKVSQMVPSDTVAAVIEVKSSLSKSELGDAYEKIASCKRLKRRPPSSSDRAPTGSSFATVGTMGIVFAFDSETSLETLAENARELNQTYSAELRPDLIVVLDKGVISYSISSPGDPTAMGMMMPPADPNFAIPPYYVTLCATSDGLFTLNRFFVMLLSQLTFFPYRVGSPPFASALAGAANETLTITSYQYDLKRQLVEVPAELQRLDRKGNGPKIGLFLNGSQQVGLVEYLPWQDGAVIIGIGVPLQGVLPHAIVSQKGFVIVAHGLRQFTSVMSISREEFKAWTATLTNGNVVARVVDEGS